MQVRGLRAWARREHSCVYRKVTCVVTHFVSDRRHLQGRPSLLAPDAYGTDRRDLGVPTFLKFPVVEVVP